MSIRGSSVYQKLREKVSEVESKSEELSKLAYKLEKEREEILIKRDNHYITLARHFLPSLEADSIEENLTEVKRELEKATSSKHKRRKELEDLIYRNRNENRALEERIVTATEEIEEHVSQREEKIKTIEEKLKEENKYAELDTYARESSKTLDVYRKRVKEAEDESARKLPEFEKNELFRYLLKIKFSTNTYRPSGKLQERLDNWVATIANFQSNKECYDFLSSMPELMRIEVEKRQSTLDKFTSQMKEIEDRTEATYGLPKINEKLKSLMQKRDDLIQEDETQDKQFNEYIQERTKLEEKECSFYKEALKNVTDLIKGEPIRKLKKAAERTKGTEDDKIVNEIENIGCRLEILESDVKMAISKRDEVTKQLSGLKEIERHFRSNNFDGSRSCFSSGFDIDSLIIGYLAGTYSSTSVCNDISSSQHTESPTYHSSRSHSSSSSSSSSSSDSSGFGSFDSFSSGGGFGGGGFSSGGGF